MNSSEPASFRAPSHAWWWYAAIIAATVAVFFLIRAYGNTLSAPQGDAQDVARRTVAAAGPATWHPLVHVAVALVAVVGVGRALEWPLAWLGQPRVIGEVLAGIVLGPSLLGKLWPGSQQLLLPAEAAPWLSYVAQAGVICYMFLVGLELNPELLRRHGQATVAVSHASIVLPFTLGSALALWLYPILSSSDVSFTAFALFLGVSMSVTAFPVLARILSDRKVSATELGSIALASAAAGDVIAWCLLALAVGVIQSQVEQALMVGLSTGAYIAVMFLLVRPLVAGLTARSGERLSLVALAAVIVGACLSSWTTTAIGVHAIFGAFLFGAVIPHQSPVARALTTNLTGPIAAFLLPAFFAYSGLRTEIGLVATWQDWLICLAIIAVATLGKFGGTLLAARWQGISWPSAAVLGALMNTRGLMELVVLNIGLDLNVISPTLFAMMVLMALATTFATAPLLALLMGHERPDATAPVRA